MKYQQGLSLIEVLIALVVLAFGLMGVAAMQLKALQSATEGYQRSIAVVAAIDAQEMVWGLLEDNDDCEAIDVSAVRDDWIKHWSADTDANPLRGANWGKSDVVSEECEITIVVSLNSASRGSEEEYRYRFILPSVEGAL